jgi:heptosyltransferase-2
MHHIDYYLGLLHAAGMKTDRVEPWIFLAPEERQSARAALSGLARPILGINPGATYGSSKRWFPERFAEVANWFLRDTRGSVVIFGSGNEVPIAEEIEYLIRKETPGEWSRTGGQEAKTLPPHPPLNKGGQEGVLNLAGKTSLRALISLISECEVFVSNDSGPMHIAYAVGTPLVAIFGSTAPELTGYGGEGSMTVRHDFDCSPCFERTCAKGDMRCMCAVTSDEVYFGIRKVLPQRKAVFFDRDGTLCKDVGYLNNWNDLAVFPEIESLRALKDRGFALLGISNQSGIARGLVDDSFAKEVNRRFVERYGFDDFFYCPHHPDDGCACRKPEPGMLVQARAKHGIDLKGSYIVGDKDADMVLARAVGARGILVKTGQQKASDHADFVVEGLREAVAVILSNEV